MLSEIGDDGQLDSMEINTSFGTLVYSFEEGSFVPVLVSASSTQIKYDIKSSILSISMSEETLLTKFGSNPIKITLTDTLGKQKKYTIDLSLIENKFKGVEDAKVIKIIKKEEYKREILRAIIESVSSVGDVIIRFSTPMKTTDFNITHINSTTVDLYI